MGDPIKKNYKFPALNENDICKKVLRLQNILGIKKKLKCKLLTETTILIKENWYSTNWELKKINISYLKEILKWVINQD